MLISISLLVLVGIGLRRHLLSSVEDRGVASPNSPTPDIGPPPATPTLLDRDLCHNQLSMDRTAEAPTAMPTGRPHEFAAFELFLLLLPSSVVGKRVGLLVTGERVGMSVDDETVGCGVGSNVMVGTEDGLRVATIKDTPETPVTAVHTVLLGDAASFIAARNDELFVATESKASLMELSRSAVEVKLLSESKTTTLKDTVAEVVVRSRLA